MRLAVSAFREDLAKRSPAIVVSAAANSAVAFGSGTSMKTKLSSAAYGVPISSRPPGADVKKISPVKRQSPPVHPKMMPKGSETTRSDILKLDAFRVPSTTSKPSNGGNWAAPTELPRGPLGGRWRVRV